MPVRTGSSCWSTAAAPGSLPRHLRHQRGPAGRRGAVPVRRRDDEGPHPALCGPRRRSLGEREVFGPDGLGRGGFVDGFSFDAKGNLWVTTVVRNGLGVLTRDGDWHVVVEDPREDALATFSIGWRQARRCRTTCWPAPARGCSSRPVCASPARICARRMWARWACRGCQPSALPSPGCRCATGPEPSERSPAGPLLGQHRQLAAEQIIRPNRWAGRGPHCNGSSA
jgi:hypothetical protein